MWEAGEKASASTWLRRQPVCFQGDWLTKRSELSMHPYSFQGENVSRDVGGTISTVSEKRLLGSRGPF